MTQLVQENIIGLHLEIYLATACTVLMPLAAPFLVNVCSTYCKKGCKPSMMQNPLKED